MTATTTTRWDRAQRFALPAAIVVVAVPFLVAVLAQRNPQWYPTLDLVMTEVRLRDVFSTEIPTIGLPGRIGDFPDQGSHPGPLSFLALAPVYKLLGSTAWAMLAATAVLNVVASSLVLWIAKRRGGAALVGVVLGMLLLMFRGWGMESLVEPWNPLMPLLWFTLLTFATWSVLCRDVAMLPVAVFAASFCAQTHVPYLLLSLGMGGLCILGVVLALRADARDGPADAPAHPQRRSILAWTAGAGILGLVLWAPPVLQQLFGESGNFSMLIEHFAADPPEAKLGLATGVEWLLINLDPIALVRPADNNLGGAFLDVALDPTRSPVPGALLVVAWLGAMVMAWRWRHRALLALHAIVATGLAVGVYSLANVFGKQWYYLTLWSWTLVCLMGLTIGWTIVGLVRGRIPADRASRLATGVGTVAFGVGVVLAVVVAVGALDDDPPDPALSRALAALIPPTAEALESGEGGATGTDGTYLVTWNDAHFIGAQGYSVVSELERLGFDAGAVERFRVPMTSHRIVDVDDATLEIRFASGAFIDATAELPGAIEVARYDPRSAVEQEHFAELRAEVIAEIEALGIDDEDCGTEGAEPCLVDEVDGNLFAVAIDPRLPLSLERKAFELLELGQPAAIFLLPPGSPVFLAPPDPP